MKSRHNLETEKDIQHAKSNWAHWFQQQCKLDNCNCHGQLPGFTIMNVRMMLCIVNVQK